MAFYGKVEYWDARYENTAHLGPCDWYRSYGQLRHLLHPMSLSGALTNTTAKQQQQQGQNPNPSRPPGLDTPVGGSSNRSVVTEPTSSTATTVTSFPDRDTCRVLIVGCGNSTFGLDMLHDGWTGGILNVDFSASVIAHMRQVHGNEIATGRIDYICADVTEPLDDLLASASFDLIVCKGTLDAVLCQARHKAINLVRQCVRLLAPGHGVLAVITSGNPDCRLEYLEHQNELSHYWRGVSVHTLKDNDQQGKNHGHSQPVSTPSPQGPGHGSSSNNASQLSSRTVYCYICRKRFLDSDKATGKENRAVATNVDSIKQGQGSMGFGQTFSM